MIELPPPKMTICSPDPDRGHWYDADQLRTYGDQRAAEARADALQALERVPMTEQQAAKMARNMHTWPEKIEEVIRATEAHHKITPPESKG